MTPGSPDRRPRLAFIESNTTGTGMAALTVADDLGYRPVLFTGDPQRYPGLPDSPAQVVVCDTNTAPALAEAVGSLPRSSLAGVLTTSEFYLPAVAGLAAWLGRPANSVEVVRRCRDKAAVRESMAAAGLRQPRFAVVGVGGDAAAALVGVGLPCVVKPVDDSGSHNVRVCGSIAEALAHIAVVLAVTHNVRGQTVAGRALIEEYVDGPEYSVEMFSVDGVATGVGVTERSLSALPYCVEQRHVYPADISPDRARSLIGLARAVLDATGVRWGPTHAELRWGPDGPVVLELNCRLAGGMIPELVRLVDGVDLLEQQVRCAVGRPLTLGATDAATAGFAGVQFVTAPRPGILRAIRGVAPARAMPGVTRVAVTAEAGARVRPPQSAYDRLGFAIARGATRVELDDRLDAVQALLAVDVMDDEAAEKDAVMV